MYVIVYSIMQMTVCLGAAAVGILVGKCVGKWWFEEHDRKGREGGSIDV